MKKKPDKKLMLSRETLRGLEKPDLAPVAGAATMSCVRTCGCPTQRPAVCGT
jgi:hypothetical protein